MMLPRFFMSKVMLFAALAMGAILAGCAPGDGYALSEADEPAYRKGESLMRENRLDEALLSFESVVDSRRDCPESHLELGRIYLDHVKDPVSAIYHFRKYLELRPDSDVARQVAQLIESAKKDFAKTLPGDPFGDSLSQAAAADQYKKLRAENEDLRRTVASLQEQLRGNRPGQSQTALAAAPQQARSAQQAQAQPSKSAGNAKSYTVQTGDTLSKISQAVYGTTARWQDIYDANKSQLKNPHDLKVGMVLVVP
jgi:tetratricopeptide (TPR) repeat protein